MKTILFCPLRLRKRNFLICSRLVSGTLARTKIRISKILKALKSLIRFPFTIGNSDDLKIGNFVFLFGNFQTGLNIRTGYVTQLNFVRYGARGEISSINENLFGISAVTVEGDSGAPIFLLRDGRFELGGMVTFLVLQARGLGFGVKINSIMDQIKRYLKENEELSFMVW